MASSQEINDVVDQLSKASVGDKIIDFSGQGLKLDAANDASDICAAIDAADEMHVLRMNGNTLGVEAAKRIGESLMKHPEFQRAQWSDMFTGRMKTEIPPAMKHLGNGIMHCNAKLVELDLSDNAFGPNGMNGIMDLLTHPSCYTLKELRLNNNGLGPTGGKMLAKCLMEAYKQSAALKQPMALKVFVSGRGRLECEGSKALSEVFKLMGSLEEVSMPQNGINHPGISALADAFSMNKNLKKLSLNDNKFTEKGATAMAKALPNMTELEVLDFGDCLLRTGGGKSVASAIKGSHSKLKEVILSFNEIETSGATQLAEAMSGKFNLQKLDLDGNQLGEEGIEMVTSIMEAIDHGDHLGSFSDDEGLSDDEDYEDYDEEEGEIIENTTPQKSESSVTATDFLQFPSPTKLSGLGQNPADIFKQHLKGKEIDPSVAVSMFMKVSSVVTTEDATYKNACQCTDVILSSAYNNKDNHSMVTNLLLVHMGFIKGEDKVSPPADISGAILVLAHVVKQSYFPRNGKEILQYFISTPSKLLENITQQKHILLQALYT